MRAQRPEATWSGSPGDTARAPAHTHVLNARRRRGLGHERRLVYYGEPGKCSTPGGVVVWVTRRPRRLHDAREVLNARRRRGLGHLLDFARFVSRDPCSTP